MGGKTINLCFLFGSILASYACSITELSGEADTSVNTDIDQDAVTDTIVDPVEEEPTTPPPECGNGILEEGEECDDGPANSDEDPNACREDCRFAHCGDDVVDTGEECDDGNDREDDECRNDCTIPACGDGILDVGEECDDGDSDDCNGCTSTCMWERALQVYGTRPGAFVEESSAPCLLSTEPFTVEVWFRMDEEIPPYTNCFFLDQREWYRLAVWRDLEGAWGFIAYLEHGGGGTNGPFMFPGPLETGIWHHMAAVYWHDGLEWRFRMFLDGVGLREWVTLYIGERECPTSYGLEIGSWGGIDCYYTLDDVRLTGAALYLDDFSPVHTLEPGPETLAMWDFNEEEDGVIGDVSGNGHDALLGTGWLVADDCHLP